MAKKKTTDEFIQDAKKIHVNKYDYSLVEYKGNRIKVNIICKKHGVFQQMPKKHLMGKGCLSCGNEKRRSDNKIFKHKSSKIHNNKYDYSLCDYLNSHTKVEIICEKHGIFEQTPNSHLSGSGCPKCYGHEKYNIETFKKICNELHGNKYDYSLCDYKNNYTKIDILCKKHGIFSQMPKNHINKKYGCPKCSNKSKGEKKIVKTLKNNNKTFNTQKSFDSCADSKKLRFDFYLPNYNMCIEYDGIQHFESIEFFGGLKAFNNLKRRDNIKNKYCKDNNIKLLRIPYWDFNNIEKIIKKELCL